MMWPEEFEPLYDERIQGELVRFYWKQGNDGEHTIRAEWHFGADPWDRQSRESHNPTRHLAIEEATAKITQLIAQEKA